MIKFKANEYKYISYYQLTVNTDFKEEYVDDTKGLTGIQFDEEGEFTTDNEQLERALVQFSKLPNNVEIIEEE